MSYIVVLDPGHGGQDAGAVFGKLIEKDINLTVALECKRILELNNVKVLMTRDKDTFVDLTARPKVANQNSAHLFVSIHHNAGGGDRGEVIYSIKGGKSQQLAFAIAEEFKNIGQQVVNTYTRANSVGTDYYAVIRLSNVPAVITEFAFLDNVNDNQIIDTIEEQKREGLAIAKGIMRVLGIAKPIFEKPAPAPAPVIKSILKIGAKGEEVKILQQVLNTKGYKLVVDGSFGPATDTAVKDFQKKNKLVADGIVGPTTKSALGIKDK